MKRKTIGVFLGGNDAQQEGVIQDAIFEHTEKSDINILSIHSMMRKPTYIENLPDATLAGESSLFRLVDLEMLDGVILLGEMIRHDFCLELVKKVRDAGIPMVSVNDAFDGTYKVIYDDIVGMKNIVLHLIRHHGCKNICCISGFKGNRESEERISAYREALEEEGIQFKEENVLYGNFYIQSIDVVKEYLKDHEMPDAFACANDTMATFITKYLIDNGYKVPGDVLVTGFDSLPDSAEYRPSLTTVARSIYDSGKKAVEILEKIWAGEEADEITEVPAHLVYGESCGCIVNRSEEETMLLNQEKAHKLIRREMFIHNMSELWRDVAFADDVQSLLVRSLKYLDNYEWDKIDFYICEDIFGKEADNEKRICGFIPEMRRVRYERGKELDFKPVFNQNILPELQFDGDKRNIYEFVPLYISDMYIGFVHFYLEHSMKDPSMLSSYLVIVDSAINNYVLHREQLALVNKLDSMYVRDELTKLYNRFGMQRYVKKIMDVAREKDAQIMCIGADLDGLKKINDEYGHAAGDNAIVQSANALRQASEHREICCRSGGDEFLVFGIADNGQRDATDYIKRVEKYLNDYNQMNDWPYQVRCSCGYCVKPAKEVHSIEDLVKIADELMYQEKMSKKTGR